MQHRKEKLFSWEDDEEEPEKLKPTSSLMKGFSEDLYWNQLKGDVSCESGRAQLSFSFTVYLMSRIIPGAQSSQVPAHSGARRFPDSFAGRHECCESVLINVKCFNVFLWNHRWGRGEGFYLVDSQ